MLRRTVLKASKRMVQARGTACTDPRIGAPTIILSERLFANPPDLEQTVLHEAAHIAVGSHHSHDMVWRGKAEQFGCHVPNNRYWRSQPDVHVYCDKCGEEGWMTHKKWMRGLRVRMRGNAFQHVCGGEIQKHADQS